MVYTRGAIVRKSPGKYEVADLRLDDPRIGEVQVKLAACGLCHSDDHVAAGHIPANICPMAGGHEGAGVVTEAAPNHKDIKEGDHVVFSFIAACGHCRWCASGMQNLCDRGALILSGARPDDPTSYRLRLADSGEPVGQMAGISAFCEMTTVSVDSVVKIDDDLPLDKVCLLGCAVGTGWGSAVNSAEVRPGDTVLVIGTGGVGINAVQGAAHCGASNIIAVDPVAFKREKACELGATHATDSIEEASELARQFTNGQGADSAIVAIGVVKPEHVGEAFSAIRKAGTCVVTGACNVAEVGAPISLFELAMYQKRLQGSLFGAENPTWDITRQIQLYRDGALKLDELITTTYSLDEIAQGYQDMHDGKNIRGVIIYD